MLGDIRQFAQREAGQAGAGFFINILPSRLVAGTVTLVRRLLRSQRVTRAMELCFQITIIVIPLRSLGLQRLAEHSPRSSPSNKV